jgi:hypothetical protein
MKYVLIISLFVGIRPLFAASIKSDTSKGNITVSRKIILSQSSEIRTDKNCPKIEIITTLIEEAIGVGAPTYNEGNHIGCYRIYEGTAYKIIYKYGSLCKQVKNILETAIEKSYGNYSSTEKAWIMRIAFDQIMGVPTQTK